MHRFIDIAHLSLVQVLAAAIALVPTGFAVIAFATTTMFSNEGREQLADIAASARTASPDRIDAREGAAVAVTGTVAASDPLGDPELFEPGEWVTVIRSVETYAWVERVHTRHLRRWGGSHDVETVTEYHLEWTATPLPPTAFRYPTGHENPRPRFSDTWAMPDQYQIGAWTIDGAFGVALGLRPILPDEVRWTDVGAKLDHDAESGWYYTRRDAAEHPALGDQRIRFVGAASGDRVTAYGLAKSGALQPIEWFEGVSLVPLIPGTRGEAERLLQGIDTTLTWVIRIGGAVAVWVGLLFIASPLFALFDIVPPVGLVVRIGGGLALLLPALSWSFLVIGTSQVVHSPGMLILLGFVAVVIAVSWWDGRRRQTRRT